MSPRFILSPSVTLVSFPKFLEPNHLLCDWKGPGTDAERLAEYAGRVCYLSYKNPSGRTTETYLQNILEQGHGSVLEHANIGLLIQGISRSCSHEIVRHRAGFAYSQQSQRYVNEDECAFVVPPAVIGNEALEPGFRQVCAAAQEAYQQLSNALFEQYSHIEDKVHRRKTAREAARSVLPNATETSMVMTGNARAWRHFLEMRGALAAEREIRRLAFAIRPLLEAAMPSVFADFRSYLRGDNEVYLESTHRKV